MAVVKEVVRYFLRLSMPNTSMAITPLKLQKLLYFAQGRHLVDTVGLALFEEDMVRWAHGPVVESVYDAYRTYGYYTITYRDTSDVYALSDDERRSIESVWDIYGSMDGKFLEELVHQEPNVLVTDKNSVISKDGIRDHFIETYGEKFG